MGSDADVLPLLLTVGHGTATAAEFLKLLEVARVQALVDIRSVPGSRHNPQFARRALEQWLVGAGVGYRWEVGLGGFRRGKPDSAHLGLHHPAFRSYADYMETPVFVAAVDRLLEEAGARTTAVMCAETLWWRCHRRLLADHLVLVRKVSVLHLDHRGHMSPHVPTAGAVVVHQALVYGPPPMSAYQSTSSPGTGSVGGRELLEGLGPSTTTPGVG
ncbi:MAG: DUF488 domain-containing protein [Candidatus Dormibacteraeota bacterium]|nr:DUF488 domain-containing protein [Candidatus Dormibacteraeota bacterium]